MPKKVRSLLARAGRCYKGTRPRKCEWTPGITDLRPLPWRRQWFDDSVFVTLENHCCRVLPEQTFIFVPQTETFYTFHWDGPDPIYVQVVPAAWNNPNNRARIWSYWRRWFKDPHSVPYSFTEYVAFLHTDPSKVEDA